MHGYRLIFILFKWLNVPTSDNIIEGIVLQKIKRDTMDFENLYVY